MFTSFKRGDTYMVEKEYIFHSKNLCTTDPGCSGEPLTQKCFNLGSRQTRWEIHDWSGHWKDNIVTHSRVVCIENTTWKYPYMHVHMYITDHTKRRLLLSFLHTVELKIASVLKHRMTLTANFLASAAANPNLPINQYLFEALPPTTETRTPVTTYIYPWSPFRIHCLPPIYADTSPWLLPTPQLDLRLTELLLPCTI